MPWLFDFAVAAMFAPFGGARKLRERALDLAGIGRGVRVLELGCGTGGVTASMLARGTEVLAIDGSRRMLAKARRRAPQASFRHMRLEDLQIPGRHDIVLLAFVLHELDSSLRPAVLRKSLTALLPTGRIAILDHAVPARGLLASVWRRLLLALEPSTVRDCIERGYRTEIEEAGGEIEAVHSLAGGTAGLMLVKPR